MCWGWEPLSEGKKGDAWAQSHLFPLCRELTEINRRHITESVNSIRRVSEPHLSPSLIKNSALPRLAWCHIALQKAPNAFPPGSVPTTSGACMSLTPLVSMGAPMPCLLIPVPPGLGPPSAELLPSCPPLQLEEAQKQRHERLLAGQQQVLQQLVEEEPKVRPGRRRADG